MATQRESGRDPLFEVATDRGEREIALRRFVFDIGRAARM